MIQASPSDAMTSDAMNGTIFRTDAPLKGIEATQVRNLFDHVTRPKDPASRKRPYQQQAFSFEMPKTLHLRFKVVTVAQELSMTEIVVRYIVAHNHLCRVEAGAEDPAAKTLLEVPTYEGTPLEGVRGTNLRDLFNYVREPGNLGERRSQKQQGYGFELPKPLHKAFSDLSGEREMTEILISYITAHVVLSRASR